MEYSLNPLEVPGKALVARYKLVWNVVYVETPQDWLYPAQQTESIKSQAIRLQLVIDNSNALAARQ